MICYTVKKQKPFDTQIHVYCTANEWYYTFAVSENHAKEAKEVLLDTWALYWEELCGYWEDLTMFDALKTAMENTGIPFQSYIHTKQTWSIMLLQACSNALRTFTNALRYKVYLYPAKDFTYRATVSRFPLRFRGRVLTQERTYPVQLTLTRRDLMGNTIYFDVTAKDRKDLLSQLRFSGRCRQDIVSLWGYDRDMATNRSAQEILENAWNRRWELEEETFRESFCKDFCTDDDADEDTSFAVNFPADDEDDLPF